MDSRHLLETILRLLYHHGDGPCNTPEVEGFSREDLPFLLRDLAQNIDLGGKVPSLRAAIRRAEIATH